MVELKDITKKTLDQLDKELGSFWRKGFSSDGSLIDVVLDDCTILEKVKDTLFIKSGDNISHISVDDFSTLTIC